MKFLSKILMICKKKVNGIALILCGVYLKVYTFKASSDMTELNINTLLIILITVGCLMLMLGIFGCLTISYQSQNMIITVFKLILNDAMY